jgi:hypothetical protein
VDMSADANKARGAYILCQSALSVSSEIRFRNWNIFVIVHKDPFIYSREWPSTYD